METTDGLNLQAWNSSWFYSKATEFLANVTKGTSLETPAAGLWCHSNRNNCAITIGKYLSYETPKDVAETAFICSRFLAKNLLLKIDSITKTSLSALGIEADPKIYETGAETYRAVADQINTRAHEITLWIAPNAESVIESNIIKAQASNQTPPQAFNALQLVGPTMFAAFAARKTLQNSQSVLYNTYLLLSGTRTVKKSRKEMPDEWTMSANIPITHEITRKFTAAKLIRDIVMETIFTAAWATSGYLAMQGMEEAIIQGGGDPTSAQDFTKWAVAATTMAPTLYGFFKAAIENEPVSDGPAKTPHLVYSNPLDALRFAEVGDQEELVEISEFDRDNRLGLTTNSQLRLLSYK